MAVLLEFSDADRPLGVTELARKFGVHKSTVSRQLGMLSRAAFVVRDHNSQKYVLGMGLLPLAASVLAKHQLNAAAKLQLELLAREVDETVTVSGWDGQNAINLHHIDPPGSMRVVAPPGRLNPSHCTATGKIFLASLDEVALRERLGVPLRRYTDETICDPQELEEQIASVRLNGFATSRGEFIAEVFSAAVHMASRDHLRSYALAVTMPVERAVPERVSTIVDALKRTALRIAELLDQR